jgi:hypothetical protein
MNVERLLSSTTQFDPTGSISYKAAFRAIFEAENIYYAVNYLVHVAEVEENTQFEIRMAKDAAEQSSEAPQAMSERGEARRGCLQEHRTRLRVQSAHRFQFTQRRVKGLKPDNIDSLDQNLA